MKYIRYEKDGEIRCGILRDTVIERLPGGLFDGGGPTGETDALNDVRVLAPVVPGKVVGMGINYYDFIRKMNIPEPKTPYIFLKAPTTVVGPGDAVVIPQGDTVNFEAELVAVIGRECKDASEEDALSYVFGFTACNDMTDRTDLLRDNHMGCSKNYDTFLPLGPAIETEMDWQGISIRLDLNGERKIDGSTNDMIFKLPQQIAFISRIMTLHPGDIILTGSPAGASPVQPGDVMEICVEHVGVLKNPVESK